MQRRYQLATLKKGHLSIPDYFRKAKTHADLLSSIGQSLGDYEINSYILACLPSEYNSLVTSVTSWLESVSLDELFGLHCNLA